MLLRDSCDFEIYAIGVTNSVDERELRSIASEPFRTHVHLLEKFEDLTKLKQLITAKGNGEFIYKMMIVLDHSLCSIVAGLLTTYSRYFLPFELNYSSYSNPYLSTQS